MKSSEVYDMMVAVGALRQTIEEDHGMYDPMEREHYMLDNGSIATRMWSILNEAHSKILRLMDEATEAEYKELDCDGDTVKCAHCKGDGEIAVYQPEENLHMPEECPTCEGKGRVPLTCAGCTKDTSGETCAECNPYAL